MKTVSVTCAIICFEDKVLAVQRSEKMKLPLKWEFAGGKIEVDENAIECIHREILEELNIKIEIKKELTTVNHQYQDFKIKLIPYVADYISGELILKEHCNSILAFKEDLKSLDWAEADLPILKEFLEL